MAEHAIAALYRATCAKATTAGFTLYSDFVPAGIPKPYYVQVMMGGGEANHSRNEDAELVLSIKCVAADLATALTGAQLLSETFNDQGTQDVGVSAALSGGTYWTINTTTKELAIHFVEHVQGATQIYHSGNRYRFFMQRI